MQGGIIFIIILLHDLCDDLTILSLNRLQCDQIGLFWKVLFTESLTKLPQILFRKI